MSGSGGVQSEAKAPWVKPEICELDVFETRRSNNTGGDGDTHADSTRS